MKLLNTPLIEQHHFSNILLNNNNNSFYYRNLRKIKNVRNNEDIINITDINNYLNKYKNYKKEKFYCFLSKLNSEHKLMFFSPDFLIKDSENKMTLMIDATYNLFKLNYILVVLGYINFKRHFNLLAFCIINQENNLVYN